MYVDSVLLRLHDDIMLADSGSAYWLREAEFLCSQTVIESSPTGALRSARASTASASALGKCSI